MGSGVDSPGRGWPGSGNWWPRRGPATRVTRLGWHRITHKRGFADRGVGCGRWVAMSGSVCASLSVDGDEGSPVQEDDARRAESLAGGWARRGRVVHSERMNPRVCSPYRSRAGAGPGRNQCCGGRRPSRHDPGDLVRRAGAAVPFPCPTHDCWLVSSWGATVGVPGCGRCCGADVDDVAGSFMLRCNAPAATCPWSGPGTRPG